MMWLRTRAKDFNRRILLVCLCGLIGAGLLPTLLFRFMGWENGFWLIAAMWRGEGGGDSWDAIGNALRYLNTRGTEQFYETLYYQANHQFIYSPLSLVFFRLTQFPPLIDWYSASRMNNVSWWVMLATIVVLALIMRESLARFGRSARAAGVGATCGMVLLATLAVSTFFPFNSGFHNGQIQTWLDFLAMLSLLLFMMGWRALAGVCIGLACIVKPQLAVMFLWAGWRRDWRFLAGGLSLVAAFGTASTIAYGWRIHADYASLVVFLSRRGESYVGNQSINGLLNRMLFLGPNTAFDATHTQIIYNPWVHAATTLSSAVMILAAVLVRSPRGTSAGILDFCTALVIATLASPVAYTHHYGLILPIFWLALLSIQAEAGRHVALYCLLAVSYAMFANNFAIFMTLANTPWNFLESMPMFGAFTLLALLYGLRFGALKPAPIGAYFPGQLSPHVPGLTDGRVRPGHDEA